MSDLRLAKRVARLGFLLDMACERAAVALTEPADLHLSDEERADVDLTNALLEVERERRDRQWAALERLLPLVPPGGSYDEAVFLPQAQASVALRALRDCGWLTDSAELNE